MKAPSKFWEESNWFAIQTKSHREAPAAALVANLELETLLPRVRESQSRPSAGNPSKALFPGYFFAHLCPLHSLEAVRYTKGVLRVVSSGRFPVPVAPEIISSIQARICPDGFIQLKPRAFRPGDNVTLETGPFEGMMGRVERESDDHARVTIFLAELLHARVSVAKSCLRTALA
jgi:transcription antitermination factor NusG